MSLPVNDASTQRADAISDTEVARRVLAGDDAAFELIMRRHNQRLFRVARGILKEDNEAEDVVQETYVRAYEHLGQFAGRSRFSTWLTRIAVYEASARRRKRRRLRVVTDSGEEDDPMQFESTNRDAAELASQGELRLLLTRAIDSLPGDLRVVVVMRMIEKLSTNETADCLSLTPANVKTRLHRARQLMQAWIDDKIGVEARQLYAFDGERCDRIVENVLRRIVKKNS